MQGPTAAFSALAGLMPACQERGACSQQGAEHAECSGRSACPSAAGALAHPAGAGKASTGRQGYGRACTARRRSQMASAALLAAVLLAAAMPVAEPASRLIIRAKARLPLCAQLHVQPGLLVPGAVLSRARGVLAQCTSKERVELGA